MFLDIVMIMRHNLKDQENNFKNNLKDQENNFKSNNLNKKLDYNLFEDELYWIFL